MKLALPLLFIFCITSSIFTCAQQRVEAHACTLSGKEYKCDKSSFEKILLVSRAVSMKAPRLDPSANEQLDKLAHALGKVIRPSGADLTFVLSHADTNGIYYGPSDRELAVIRVYYGAEDSAPGEMVWVESYYGQPDTPWPIVVNHLTNQFRDRFKH
jgi:hypothetical protein